MTRSAVKQIRTLEFEITLAPRNNRQDNHHRGGGGNGGGGHSGRRHHGQSDTQHEFDMGGSDHYGGESAIVQQPQRFIDARNEQEFPSLGGASASSSFSLRPNVSIRTQSYGSAGLARTKENFPALGGGTTQSATTTTPASGNGAAPASGSYRQGSASSLLKQQKTPAANTGAVSKQPGMVIHVSNRPAASAAAVAKKGAKDFPSLPGANNSKKALLEQDFVAPSPSTAAYSNSIAAKHRNLYDGYEQMVAADAVAKLSLVKTAPAPLQQQQQRTTNNKQPETVPKINSKNNFPTLGSSNASGAAMAPQWVALTKKAPVESRKSKVAPPPLSATAPPPATATTYPALAATKVVPPSSSAAKPTVVKTKPSAPVAKQSVAPSAVHQPQSTAVKQTKNSKKLQKHNDAAGSDDDAGNDYQLAASSTVLGAVSAKHRSLVDNYESVAKTATTKLSMVQRSSETSKGTTTAANVPKLNSRDNFPSLSSATPEPNNNNNKPRGINFLDIVKNSSSSSEVSSKQNGNYNNDNNGAVTAASGPVDAVVSNNGIAGPPPGFGAPPPPGFKSVTVSSVAKPLGNNLTFTTSMGECFSIMPAQHAYLPPPNASKRNQVR